MKRRAILSFSLAVVGTLAVSAPGLAEPPNAAPPKPSKAPESPLENPKVAVGGLSAEEIADRVQTFYDKTKTFRAGFRQRYLAIAYNKTKESTGSVIFEKPGKMSWRYSTNANRVVADGKTLRVYEDENKQMYEQPMDQSQYPAALSFLVGGGNVKKSFVLSKLDAERAKFSGGFVLVGEPRDPTPAYQKILLYVDAKTSQVRRVLLIDAQGNRNRFDFENPVVNKKPLPDEFRFVPPKGTKVIKP
jgi:outer membrane lipoprotein carrier protein